MTQITQVQTLFFILCSDTSATTIYISMNMIYIVQNLFSSYAVIDSYYCVFLLMVIWLETKRCCASFINVSNWRNQWLTLVYIAENRSWNTLHINIMRPFSTDSLKRKKECWTMQQCSFSSICISVKLIHDKNYTCTDMYN